MELIMEFCFKPLGGGAEFISLSPEKVKFVQTVTVSLTRGIDHGIDHVIDHGILF